MSLMTLLFDSVRYWNENPPCSDVKVVKFSWCEDPSFEVYFHIRMTAIQTLTFLRANTGQLLGFWCMGIGQSRFPHHTQIAVSFFAAYLKKAKKGSAARPGIECLASILHTDSVSLQTFDSFNPLCRIPGQRSIVYRSRSSLYSILYGLSISLYLTVTGQYKRRSPCKFFWKSSSRRLVTCVSYLLKVFVYLFLAPPPHPSCCVYRWDSGNVREE